jgi:hypothetical protein
MISPSRGEVSYEAQIIHGDPSRVFHLCQRLGLYVYPAAIGSRHLGLEIRRSCSSSFASRPWSDRGSHVVVVAHSSFGLLGILFQIKVMSVLETVEREREKREEFMKNV